MIASLTPYPRMKESGVQWLGEIPVHWETHKLRNLLRRVTERNQPDLPLLSVVRRHGVILRDIDNRDENHNYIPDDLSSYKVVQAGQFAMNKMKAWQGSFGVSPYTGIVSPAYFVFNLAGVDGAFFHTAIRSHAYVPSFAQASDGVRIGQWDLDEARMREVHLAVPPRPEQEAIVRFLDHADRRLRRYIRAKQKLIGLLTEQRKTIIHRAVTSGLNPNVRLRPSGIGWVGDIPEHWTTSRLRDTVRGCYNGVWGEEPDGQNDLVCVRVADFERAHRRVSLDRPTLRAIAPNLRGARLLQRGDLLIEKSGGGDQQPVGMVVLYDHDTPAVCSNFVARMPAAKGFDPRYLVYVHEYLYSIRLNARSIKQTTGIQNLDSDAYLNEPMAFPPPSEQDLIVQCLDRETALIAAGIDSAHREIGLLRELSVRLVADVVTGKRDVRDAAARLPTELEPFDEDADHDLAEEEGELAPEMEAVEV